MNAECHVHNALNHLPFPFMIEEANFECSINEPVTALSAQKDSYTKVLLAGALFLNQRLFNATTLSRFQIGNGVPVTKDFLTVYYLFYRMTLTVCSCGIVHCSVLDINAQCLI
jgi:hypothetical protein